MPQEEQKRPFGTDKVTWIGIVIIIGVLAVLLLPAIGHHEDGTQARCLNNQKNLALAVKNFAAVHGHYPPAYTVDENGNRLHSWRTLMLPYLERNDLYKQINLDEPWDSPANLKAFKGMGVPEFYQCPSDRDLRNTNFTSYAVIVGTDTPFDPAQEVTSEMMGVNDGESYTLMIVEMQNSDIPWYEPRDLALDDLNDGINNEKITDRPTLGSQHPGIIIAAFCDGRMVKISEENTVKMLRMLASFQNDGEPLDYSQLK